MMTMMNAENKHSFCLLCDVSQTAQILTWRLRYCLFVKPHTRTPSYITIGCHVIRLYLRAAYRMRNMVKPMEDGRYYAIDNNPHKFNV